jgi:hypothetical protein
VAGKCQATELLFCHSYETGVVADLTYFGIVADVPAFNRHRRNTNESKGPGFAFPLVRASATKSAFAPIRVIRGPAV